MKTIKLKSSWKRLIMFDFDDTLAKTYEATLVRDIETGRIVNHLANQEEFDEHVLNDKKHEYDFSEFNRVSNLAEPIDKTIGLLDSFLRDKDNKVIILTARQSTSRNAIRKFIEKQGIDTTRLSIFGSGGSEFKAPYLLRLIKRFNITDSVLVFEDSLMNIKRMVQSETLLPDLTFNYIQVIDPDSDEDLEEAKKFSYPKGEYGTEPYQRILKSVHPAMKRRLIGLGSNDYLIKGTKKVKDFKRSKSAPPSG